LFYHGVVRRPQYILKDIFGLYKELQLVSIAEGVINLVLSFLLVHDYGITGVLVASVVATLLTNFWYFPLLLYKKIFNKKMWLDIGKYLLTTAITVGMLAISIAFYPSISAEGYVIWFLQSAVYAVLVLIILFVIFYVTFQSFRRLVHQCLEMLKPILKRGAK